MPLEGIWRRWAVSIGTCRKELSCLRICIHCFKKIQPFEIVGPIFRHFRSLMGEVCGPYVVAFFI